MDRNYYRMVRMKLDCNSKILANFFKFSLCALGKSLKTDYSLSFLGEKPYDFLPGVLKANSCYRQGSLSNI